MLAGRRLDKMASRCKKMNRRTKTHITIFIILFFITLSKISSKQLSEKYQQNKSNELEANPYTKTCMSAARNSTDSSETSEK